MQNIIWMEDLLKGGDLFKPAPRQANPGFKGLHAPRWQEAAKYLQKIPIGKSTRTATR